MKRELSPQESSRAEAFRLWMSSPMPMVTLVKTSDIGRLVKVSKKSGMKINMLMSRCIGKTASGTSAMIQTELDCIVNPYCRTR